MEKDGDARNEVCHVSFLTRNAKLPAAWHKVPCIILITTGSLIYLNANPGFAKCIRPNRSSRRKNYHAENLYWAKRIYGCLY